MGARSVNSTVNYIRLRGGVQRSRSSFESKYDRHQHPGLDRLRALAGKPPPLPLPSAPAKRGGLQPAVARRRIAPPQTVRRVRSTATAQVPARQVPARCRVAASAARASCGPRRSDSLASAHERVPARRPATARVSAIRHRGRALAAWHDRAPGPATRRTELRATRS